MSAALGSLTPLFGSWRTEASNASWLEPGEVLTGELDVSRVDGAFLVLRSRLRRPVPNALSVIGHDDAEGRFSVMYHDERGVSRLYAMTFDGRVWTQWREDPDAHQRYRGVLSEDGTRIEASWSISHDAGATWEHDMDLLHVRVGHASS